MAVFFNASFNAAGFKAALSTAASALWGTWGSDSKGRAVSAKSELISAASPSRLATARASLSDDAGVQGARPVRQREVENASPGPRTSSFRVDRSLPREDQIRQLQALLVTGTPLMELHGLMEQESRGRWRPDFRHQPSEALGRVDIPLKALLSHPSLTDTERGRLFEALVFRNMDDRGQVCSDIDALFLGSAALSRQERADMMTLLRRLEGRLTQSAGKHIVEQRLLNGGGPVEFDPDLRYELAYHYYAGFTDAERLSAEAHLSAAYSRIAPIYFKNSDERRLDKSVVEVAINYERLCVVRAGLSLRQGRDPWDFGTPLDDRARFVMMCSPFEPGGTTRLDSEKAERFLAAAIHARPKRLCGMLSMLFDRVEMPLKAKFMQAMFSDACDRLGVPRPDGPQPQTVRLFEGLSDKDILDVIPGYLSQMRDELLKAAPSGEREAALAGLRSAMKKLASAPGMPQADRWMIQDRLASWWRDDWRRRHGKDVDLSLEVHWD